MKKFLLFLLVVIVALSAVMVFRAFTHFSDTQYVVTDELQPILLDEASAVDRFARAIRYRTISHDDVSQFDPVPFVALREHIQGSFPLVHARAEREIIGDYSLVFHLPGSDTSLKPALFMGHLDVVPVDEATRDDWQQPPFSGAVVDGTIWGRGTIDDKISVMALLEALESLLAKGLAPKRSLYFAFGHDEEIGGKAGAAAIAAKFAERGINFEFVLDEGGLVTEGLVAGVEAPVAIIGIAEKGFLNLRLTVRSEGGHSSQPPANTAAGILAQAIVKVEENPFPSQLTYSQMTFEEVGHQAPFAARLTMANLWLLSPLVERFMLSNPTSAASLRTTTAATMLSGSSKSNILPTEASAVVNFRLLPGDSIEYVINTIIDVIDDPRVEVTPYMASEASAVSPTDSFGYQLIERTIRRLDNEVLVAPYLVLGGTDASHYEALSDNIYRFMMVRLNPQSLSRFHGVNEQISVEDYLQAVRFYAAMLEQAASGKPL